ncbi:hypothetical protein HAX54_044737 [Datura stramonium]|uniref:Ribosomal protein L2 n=1 Tax=Datura stramonium TaxID=4076 RepID=A0ABS8SR26_DATST|nr:hypothetical protein [Datura stramonium]
MRETPVKRQCGPKSGKKKNVFASYLRNTGANPRSSGVLHPYTRIHGRKFGKWKGNCKQPVKRTGPSQAQVGVINFELPLTCESPDRKTQDQRRRSLIGPIFDCRPVKHRRTTGPYLRNAGVVQMLLVIAFNSSHFLSSSI